MGYGILVAILLHVSSIASETFGLIHFAIDLQCQPEASQLQYVNSQYATRALKRSDISYILYTSPWLRSEVADLIIRQNTLEYIANDH
jgi:hypothetical protein